MSISFTCTNCGKPFEVDEHLRGKRGRCSQCWHVMRIPGAAVAEPKDPLASASEPVADPPFKLSPPEPHPFLRGVVPHPAALPAASQPMASHHSVILAAPASVTGAPEPHANQPHIHFELLDDDADPASIGPVSPELTRGLQEIAEFEKDRRGYRLVGDGSGLFSFFGLRESGPAGWIYTKWRAGVSFVLKLLRWIDTWAYLISVPFFILMILGIAAENRPFIHTGAVVVVLANYGRFWADLLAFFVRPYKDGPLYGLAFLFPPYMFYYLATRWDRMKMIVRRIATSCIPIVLVVIIYGFLPAANPELTNVHGFGAKLRAGKDELDKEIQNDINAVEERLIKNEKPREKRRSLNLDHGTPRPHAEPDR